MVPIVFQIIHAFILDIWVFSKWKLSELYVCMVNTVAIKRCWWVWLWLIINYVFFCPLFEKGIANLNYMLIYRKHDHILV